MEVEAKFRISEAQRDALRAQLVTLGARPEGARSQDDLFFRHPARDFVATDEALRYRRERGGGELTYKGPRVAGDIKMRPEFNVGVASDPTELLRALGFVPAAHLVKTREPWQADGAEIALDHVEGVGWFVEIEAKGHPDPAAHVEALRDRLGLGDAAPVTQSYLELALATRAGAARHL